MEPFPHLQFIQKIIGKARLFGGGGPNAISDANRNDRQGHSGRLRGQANQVRNDWDADFSLREGAGFAPLEPEVVPVFLKLNPDIVNGLSDFELTAFGIEIISEENDGFIVGASVDKLRSLENKINGFITQNYGSAVIADLWQIIDGRREEWKPRHVLSDTLLERWAEIREEDTYHVEVGVAFDNPMRPEPDRTKRGGETRYLKYQRALVDRDDKLMQRETHFEDFINFYGHRISDIVHLNDSFGCEVEISGKGLKDLVYNYPYVFEVNELDEIGGIIGGEGNLQEEDLEIVPPAQGAPIIGVIDSGFMEGHRYLQPATDHENAKSYLNGDPSTVDQVRQGGHGTRVGGAILYPLGISKYQSPYQLVCFLRNLRILDGNNHITHRSPAVIIKRIVDDNPECSIFNLSVGSTRPFRKKHISLWAACLDQEMHDKNKLFIISAGNILRDVVRHYIRNGNPYPRFLQERYCAIANPGQSCFSLTVGSVNHTSINDPQWMSLGEEREVSAFSRIGPGIWNTIKPDVVEFGGGLVISTNDAQIVKTMEATSPELLRSTLDGGPAIGYDAVGTSFSAPKVTHIAAHLQALYPAENVNLIRALIIQGARLPDGFFLEPTTEIFNHLGYGIPSLSRVTRNTDHRATFYNTGHIAAEEGHLFSLKIPATLRNPGDEYDILIEVTLAFTGGIRRTRQKVKSYLGTWLTWDSAKLDEQIDSFREYALKKIEDRETMYDSERRKQMRSIPWKLGTRTDTGEVEEYRRGNNTVQKDWAVVKSYDLREEIGFVVSGHKGWDRNREPIPYAFVVSLEILGNNIPIYELLRLENELEQEV
jgi:hypothetical protein